jgi:ketosteroid isomerase-like protein
MFRGGECVRVPSGTGAVDAILIAPEMPEAGRNVEIAGRLVAAWNRREGRRTLDFVAPEIEWLPASPVAVKQTVYRGYDEVMAGLMKVWETWEEVRFEPSEVRDLGDSVLWLGYLKARGGTGQIELDLEFAMLFLFRYARVVRVEAFPAWQAAVEAVGLSG